MRTLSAVLKQQYGEKIYKLSLTSGCICPNRDGTVGFGGCAFCSEGGSGEFASSAEDIEIQIKEAKERIQKKVSARRFIAYFQSFTNTYGDVGRLARLYDKVIRRDDIVILSIGTTMSKHAAAAAAWKPAKSWERSSGIMLMHTVT